MIKNFDRYFEKNENLETEYLKILYYDLEVDYKGTYNSYQYTRLCTIANGSKHVKINDGSEFTYTSSDCIILPPNASVNMDIKEHTTAVVYEISDKLLEDTIKKIEIKYNTPIDIDEPFVKKKLLLPQVKNHIERINQYALSKDPNKAYLIDLCSQELAYNLIQYYKLSIFAKKEVDPVSYIINALKTHLSDTDYTVKKIASELKMSPSNLILIFRKATGVTPKHYHNMLKLNRSKELLRQNNVSEVCYALGFVSNSHFIQMFKKQFGITPKQYSLMQKNQVYLNKYDKETIIK